MVRHSKLLPLINGFGGDKTLPATSTVTNAERKEVRDQIEYVIEQTVKPDIV